MAVFTLVDVTYLVIFPPLFFARIFFVCPRRTIAGAGDSQPVPLRCVSRCPLAKILDGTGDKVVLEPPFLALFYAI